MRHKNSNHLHAFEECHECRHHPQVHCVCGQPEHALCHTCTSVKQIGNEEFKCGGIARHKERHHFNDDSEGYEVTWA